VRPGRSPAPSSVLIFFWLIKIYLVLDEKSKNQAKRWYNCSEFINKQINEISKT
jgi:cell division protein FtsW (lipid II flippase)